MAENEFIDNQDKFGIFGTEPETYKFLTVDSSNSIEFVFNNVTGVLFNIYLSSRKNELER